MQVIKLILHIISTVTIVAFGLGMTFIGIHDIKESTYPKYVGYIAILAGVLAIVFSVISWFW